MIVTRKHLDRRAFLQGVGAVLALPLLDSMVPAFAGPSNTLASPTKRWAVAYVPNGIVMGSGPRPLRDPLSTFLPSFNRSRRSATNS
jgi:hypothetical protein